MYIKKDTTYETSYKFLLGMDNNNDFVVANIRMSKSEREVFSVSFDTLYPFNYDDFDFEGYLDGWLEDLDADTKISLMQDYDCTPAQLASVMARYESADEYLDIDYTFNSIDIDGSDWMFRLVGCGQHDTRKNGMFCKVDEVVYDLIHVLWDNYHLVELDDTGKAILYGVLRRVDETSIDEEIYFMKTLIKERLL